MAFRRDNKVKSNFTNIEILINQKQEDYNTYLEDLQIKLIDRTLC
jgi:hypothetical protein